MHFSFFTKTALCTLAVLGQVAAKDPSQDHEKCEKGPFAGSSPKAGEGYSKKGSNAIKCHSEWPKGEVITGMHIWRAKSHIKAIRFKYSKRGWVSSTHGSIDKYVKEDEGFSAEWDATQQVKIDVYNAKKQDYGPAVSRIVVKTNEGDTLLDVGSNDKYRGDLGNPSANQGGGLILAVKADAAAKLHYIEFKMLKSKVKSAKMVDVKLATDLDTLNKEQQGIGEEDVETIYFVNGNKRGGSNMIYNTSGEKGLKTYKEINTETRNEWSGGVSVTVGANVGLPILGAYAETTTSVNYERSKYEQIKESDEKTYKFAWRFDCDPKSPLRPQEAVKCYAKTISGAFEAAFEGTVETELEDGSKYNVKQKGTARSLTYATRTVRCDPVDIKDVPEEAKMGDTKEVGKEKRKVEEEIGDDLSEEERPQAPQAADPQHPNLQVKPPSPQSQQRTSDIMAAEERPVSRIRGRRAIVYWG